MNESVITINVKLNEDKVPEQINWQASASTVDDMQKAKAMMLAFWDSAEKTALRIDLWTQDMMVDEMADFYYQTLMTMAETYNRATHHTELVNDMKAFAKSFYDKFQKSQLEQQKG